MLERWGGTDKARLSASASFRGLNNASDELIGGLKKLADKHGTLLQTHACFSYSTHDCCMARCGLAEIERLEKLGVLDERMLVVHSGWLEPQEVAILAEAQAVAGVRAVVQPAQRLRQFRRRQAAGADGARRQRRDRLRPRVAPASSTWRRRCGSPAAATRRCGSTRASCRRRPASRWRRSTAPRRR